MGDNLSEVLKNLTSGMDRKAINRAIPEFKRIISTPEGQRLVSAIRTSDKESLAKLISGLKQGGNPEEALKHASEHPDILENLSRLLKKEEKI